MKDLIRKYVPTKTIIQAQNVLNKSKKKRIKDLLDALPEETSYLDMNDLKKIIQQYDLPPDYGYELKDFKNRGQARAIALEKLMKDKKGITKTLEIGAQDGMVSYYLNKNYSKE